MPLLLCPNDNSAMQTVQRSGVEFDMCPTCRGVWLDRGELEKLMASEGPPAAPRLDLRPPQGHDRPRYDDDYRDGYRKKKGSIFDIFD
jgi:Zn-finger nucleic acid-binding protein